MAFTAKTRVSVEDAGSSQKLLRFSANYTDAEGNRVNEDWAEATPSFNLSMYVVNEVVEANSIETGQEYTLTFEKDA